MALQPCGECGKQVSSQAKSCPHCGANIPRTSALTGCLAILLFFVIVVMFIGVIERNQPPSSPSSAPCQNISEATASQLIDDAKNAGMIYSHRLNTVNPSLLSVQVTNVWMQLSFDAKHGIDAALLCSLIKDRSRYHIDYYDFRSGRHIAKSSWAEDLAIE